METPSVIDTGAIIDARKIGARQIAIVFLCACAIFVEGFDTSVIGYIAPPIAKLWHVSPAAMGNVLSADLLGLLMGYLALAPFSARFGHKRILAASTLWFGAMTVVTSSSTGIDMLFACRFLTGLGVGAAMPCAVALAGEYMPERRRSTSITMVYIGFSVGQVMSGVTASALLQFGWYAPLLAGGAVTVLIGLALIAFIPESLEYLINRGNGMERARAILRHVVPELSVPDNARLIAGARGGRKVAMSELLQEGRMTGTLLIWLALFMNLLVYYFMQKWLPSVLVQVGLSQQTSIWITNIGFAGGILAAFIIGPLMDRFGPYMIVVGLFVCGAIAGAGLASQLAMPEALAVGAMALGLGFCLSGSQKANNALTVYFYPTALRGTGLGWALGIGRIGGALGPWIAGNLLMQGWHPSSLFYVSAIPMLIGAASIWLMSRVTVGARQMRLAQGEA